MLTNLRLAFYGLFPPKAVKGTVEALDRYSSYYRYLSQPEKERFLRRLYLFLRFVRFHSAPGLVLDERMKIIIAGAAVQFTFGLRRFIFRHYQTIQLMPNQYHIPEFSADLLGHVDRNRRTITMSWPSLEHSFLVPDDAFNVALHEISHVILFENTLRFRYEEFFSRISWDEWNLEAEKKWKFMQYHKSRVLREYAGKNMLELFAVSIETFFEQPELFKKHLPRLYGALSRLLKQDPTNRAEPVFHFNL